MSASGIIFVVEESPEVGYEAKALGTSIYTQAESLNELRTMVQDAVRGHFDEHDRPKMIRLHLVHDDAPSLRLPRSLSGTVASRNFPAMNAIAPSSSPRPSDTLARPAG